jgi:hypothetical protein
VSLFYSLLRIPQRTLNNLLESHRLLHTLLPLPFTVIGYLLRRKLSLDSRSLFFRHLLLITLRRDRRLQAC